VKPPRFRIAWVMLAVAIAAIDFGAIRALLYSPAGELLILGALPMANVLAIGLLVGQRRPENSPALTGFVTFGAVALALYVASALLFTDPHGSTNPYLTLLNVYLDLWRRPVEKYVERVQPLFSLVLCAGYVIMLGWPQVAFGLIGGALSRRYKITITHRQ
jgi:hypothetical protein